MKENRINHITDLLQLSSDQLQRMLPDLIAWHKYGKHIQNTCDVRVKTFIWVDDNKQGECLGIRVEK